MGKIFKRATTKQILFGSMIAIAITFGAKKDNIFNSYSKNSMLISTSLPIEVPKLEYNINTALYQIEEGIIKNGQVLSEIFAEFGVENQTLLSILDFNKDVFDVRTLRAGKKYKVYKEKDTQKPKYFIYEPDKINYLIFNLEPDSEIIKGQRPVDTLRREFAGEITSSLWNAFSDYDIESAQIPVLTAKMEDALAWSVDFHHIQPNDQFKLIFDEYYVDGELVSIGEMEAAWFSASGKEYYAISFDNGKYDGYYNLEGRPMKKAFLKAPVKFSRISSRYNLNRFHPVLKTRRPHLGTDYAAPYNTEIYATANGVIDRIGRTGGNGNFIRIKHDDTYSTQYLHMNKFAKGMKKGVHVKQGEVIGYVGSTGLATGPHVCYRFWKNGKQVDPLRENLPEPAPMDDSYMPAFTIVKDRLKNKLDQITLQPKKSIAVETDSLQIEEALL